MHGGGSRVINLCAVESPSSSVWNLSAGEKEKKKKTKQTKTITKKKQRVLSLDFSVEFITFWRKKKKKKKMKNLGGMLKSHLFLKKFVLFQQVL